MVCAKYEVVPVPHAVGCWYPSLVWPDLTAQITVLDYIECSFCQYPEVLEGISVGGSSLSSVLLGLLQTNAEGQSVLNRSCTKVLCTLVYFLSLGKIFATI